MSTLSEIVFFWKEFVRFCREKKAGGLCTPSCKCLLAVLGGLALAALLAVAIAIPIVVNLSTEENERTTITTRTSMFRLRTLENKNQMKLDKLIAKSLPYEFYRDLSM